MSAQLSTAIMPLHYIVGFWSRHPYLCSIGVLYGLLTAYQRLFTARYPKNLPLIREPAGTKSFSLRTRAAFHSDCLKLFSDAYENYSRRGRTVLVPGLGFRDEIILPESAIRWILSQPESVLSSAEAHVELDQVQYFLGDVKYVRDAWPGKLMRRELSFVMESVSVDLLEELFLAVDDQWGLDTDNWTEVDVVSTIRTIIARAASRFIVGLPLCRNKDYIQEAMAFNDGALILAGGVGLFPSFMKDLVGYFMSPPLRRVVERMQKHFAPVYEERVKLMKRAQVDPSVSEPQDILQMMLRFAQEERPEDFNVETMTKRLATANKGSMHQSTFAAVNLILDIVSSNQEYNTISALRDEVYRVIGPEPASPAWAKANISKMTLADSVIRESLRMCSPANRSLLRSVVADDVRTEDGVELPKGSMVSVLSYTIHHNEDIFQDALKFEPFRYARLRNDPNNMNSGNLGLVTTGPQFLPFGHGKHACPGRFLLDFEFKMLIAYLLDKYEITFPEAYGGKRPESLWFAEANFLPQAKLLVKRIA